MTVSGLEGVVVAETELSRVDGERGELIIRGHRVDELAGRASFAEVCALVWHGSLEAEPSLSAALGRARLEAFARLGSLGDALEADDAMDALRAGLAHLACPVEAEQVAITGTLAVLAAAWWRARRGEAPLAPDPALSHAADLLRMLDGRTPEPARVQALETYWATVVDHGMNASTFTARVVASTRSDGVSAVVAALGALKGPLHGGAPGPVLDMLDAIQGPERAEEWLRGELSAGRRIMGMGHRVYRVRDPRAAVLEREVERLEQAGLGGQRLVLARAVERAAQGVLRERYPARRLEANVEFYTAILLDAVGVDRRLFSALFALSRVAGWLAHVGEERARGRLIRPRARYVGP